MVEKELAPVARAMRHFVMSANHHVGGSLSPVDFLTALYFSGDYRLDVTQRLAADRDKYVHSKGHAAAAHYFALWLHGWLGDVPLDELLTFGAVNHRLPRIPQIQQPRGLEMTTGSLGQGLSFANGLALADRRAGRDTQTLVLFGDAELSEGQVWESAQTTVRLGLENVTVAVDANGFGSHMSTLRDSIGSWWKGFGWKIFDVDGHDLAAVHQGLTRTREESAPSVLLMHTTKGYGLLPPYSDSPDAGGEVPVEYRPQYDLEADIEEALRAVAERFPQSSAARQEPLAEAVVPVRESVRLSWDPARNPVGQKMVSKKFAEELVDHITPGGDLFVVSPDAIRNSGLLPMLDAHRSWSWSNPTSPVLEHQIAEQDVASMAAGATAAGLRTVVFLMEGFVWRMIDSLRQSICFPGIPVVIVGTSAGLGDELGQMVQSDACFAAVRSLPGLTVLEANDINEAKVLFNEALALGRPVYLRLAHEALPVLTDLGQLLARDTSTGVWTLRDEEEPDLVMLAAGSMVPQALEAADRLSAEGDIRIRVANVFSASRFAGRDLAFRREVVPLDVPSLSVHNGPPSVLGEFLSPHSTSIGLTDYGMHGKPVSDLYEACGLGVGDIVRAAQKLLSDG
ncbi:transketolase C-terminal domain-containing protein [Streptomyces sp. NPDC005355]|uniref:transketolase-like TK C-terminal-containing protein n=1 Tax=Streptomyces sp. NPDC005355 TaxID=3157038 RepID=UPI0033A93BDE